MKRIDYYILGLIHLCSLKFRWLLRFDRRMLPVSSYFIISLTSYPKRFPFLYLTLQNLLLENNDTSFKIIVNLYKPDLDKLPNKLRKLTRYGVIFNEVDKDMRVYSKLIPTLEKYRESRIITLDDDIKYDRNVVRDLMKVSEFFPHAVIGHRGLAVPGTNFLDFPPYVEWKEISKETVSNSGAILLTGVGGVCYPPNFGYKPRLDVDRALKVAPNADDLWYFWYEVANKMQVVCLGNILGEPRSWPFSQSTGLWKANVGRGMNDSILKNLFRQTD